MTERLSEFKFKVGEWVQLVGPEGNTMLYGRVTSRLLEECIGGVQPQYLVRVVAGNGAHREPWRLHEFELGPYQSPVKAPKEWTLLYDTLQLLKEESVVGGNFEDATKIRELARKVQLLVAKDEARKSAEKEAS